MQRRLGTHYVTGPDNGRSWARSGFAFLNGKAETKSGRSASPGQPTLCRPGVLLMSRSPRSSAKTAKFKRTRITARGISASQRRDVREHSFDPAEILELINSAR